MSDELQSCSNGQFYVENLINQVHKMSDEVIKKDEEAKNEKETLAKKKTMKQTGNKRCSSAGLIAKSEPKKLRDIDKTNERFRSVNSLGLTLEATHGISMVVLSGASLKSLNKSTKLNESINEENSREEKFHKNLEDLIENLANNDESEDNYLKMAKLNRLKVISELSVKLIGRKFRELNEEERSRLETEANRFSSTHPIPDEEENPIKLVEENGVAKIEINENVRIDPDEFIKIYTNKMINHAQDSTGIQVKCLAYFRNSLELIFTFWWN